MNALPSGSRGILVEIWVLAQIQLFLHELAQVDTFPGFYRSLLAFGANLVVSRGNATVYAFRGISLALLWHLAQVRWFLDNYAHINTSLGPRGDLAFSADSIFCR